MVKNTLIFIPDTLQTNKSGYLEGVHKLHNECEAFYITNNTLVKETADIIGYVSSDAAKIKIKDFKGVHLDNLTNRVTIINNSSADLVKIVYDYEAFRKCDGLNSENQYGVHFKFLMDRLRRGHQNKVENGRRNLVLRLIGAIIAVLDCFLSIFNRVKSVWGYSATITHFCDNLTSCKWCLSEAAREKRVTPKIGNFILAKFVDLALGIFLLRLFIENEEVIVRFIEDIRETIIHNFRDLLTYLMGSPIGLKLNHAFNKSLGTFFFYHISLWRIFLVTAQPAVKEYFKFLVLPGAFGFSYQVAMVSDLISIATFHVYCIYVYAARLIYLQLKGLLSLWRLFIGRKYNPLRVRVDSHQYSQHQLFIGTLGFTVLLFLLPTTTMYYTVFVIFRLAIMIVEEILIRIRYFLHCLPIYVLILWLIKSPYMTGSICLKYKRSKDGVATFQAHLKMLPLTSSIAKSAPQTIKTNAGLSWGKIFTGVLL
ncbi:Gpi1 domain containing protein [Asbolus verrucosus]|uniref:Gpi1 domain containing protein n=1 Tax=Asbolus verrucosus TaxID=1661398 RepID=A0A482WBX5_ASBVE|nr:Gpi1 domain containing protein [Asbolus verrucosus]